MNKSVETAEDIRMASAVAQARAISAGVVESAELAASEAAAIEKYNPQLNAFIQRVNSTGRLCNEWQSPLSGSTFAVKDNFDVIGLPTHAGLRAFATGAATSDATVVKRLQQAGLVLTGKLNMSPMAMGASTHNRDFGDCFNPHRSAYSAGGSSGGSASAVAAGLVGIALGTDTMGSVRLPAALCGVVGFKPSWGRLPVNGLVPLCKSLDHIGVLSRSVEDACAAFTIMSVGPSEHAKTIACLQHSAVGTHRHVDSGKLRLGVPCNTTALQLQPDVEAAFASACTRLSEKGYSLEAIDMGSIDLSRVRRAGLMLCEAELQTTLKSLYPEQRQLLPDDLTALLDFISRQSAEVLGRAVARLAESRYRFEGWMADLDALVLPTCAHSAFPMSSPPPADIADLTVIANVMGAPAISLPLPVATGDLPVGLQLVGRYGHDEALLGLASEVEAVLKPMALKPMALKPMA